MGVVMKKLFLDYEKYTKIRNFKTECDFFYHQNNEGVASLIELTAFSLICRQCEDAPCVVSCPKEALEKQEDGTVKRYNMRCIACRSCVLACPFGTLYPEVINYFAHKCDYCLKNLKDEIPLCVKTSSDKEILQYKDIEEDKRKHNFAIGDCFIVHSAPWKKEEKKKK